jgi:hypothetical protein
MDGEGRKNHTDLQMRQRRTETVHEICHRLKSSRPKADGVDSEMEEKKCAEEESGDGEALARAGKAAAPAVALFSRDGKIHRQQFTGQQAFGLAGMARPAALATIARWKLFKVAHLFHGAAAKGVPRNANPLSRKVNKQS